MSYGMSITLDRPFDETVDDVRSALAAEGFGVLTEIDMQATLHAKLGVEIDRYLILGACNPGFANQSLRVEPSIGLLLPCNVVVRRTDAGTVVEAVDPKMLVEVTGNPGMEAIAHEVGDKLAAALGALGALGAQGDTV